MSNVKDTLEERESTYGHYPNQAMLSQSLKAQCRYHRDHVVHKTALDAFQAEALEMILHKIARIVNGDPNHYDSWHDISGYATLVCQQLKGTPINLASKAKSNAHVDAPLTRNALPAID